MWENAIIEHHIAVPLRRINGAFGTGPLTLDLFGRWVHSDAVQAASRARCIMSNLWIYWRRPCCIVRYRHGGEGALYPVIKQPLVGNVLTAQGGAVATAVPVEATPVRENNILHFPKPSQRAASAPRPRAGRHKGKGPKRRE